MRGGTWSTGTRWHAGSTRQSKIQHQYCFAKPRFNGAFFSNSPPCRPGARGRTRRSARLVVRFGHAADASPGSGRSDRSLNSLPGERIGYSIHPESLRRPGRDGPAARHRIARQQTAFEQNRRVNHSAVATHSARCARLPAYSALERAPRIPPALRVRTDSGSRLPSHAASGRNNRPARA